MENSVKKPSWIKVRMTAESQGDQLNSMVHRMHLHTVCQEASCPNLGECFGKGTATFMILGDLCTRNCRFCGVKKGQPFEPDKDEPIRIAKAVKELGLKHVVITSVTRDDLADDGAAHFAATVRAIRQLNPATTVELLIPDLKGNWDHLHTILDEGPEILNHNLETVPKLYSEVRPGADYQRSMDLLREVKRYSPTTIVKTGIMLGLGENQSSVQDLMKDIKTVECDIMTIGQYLQPTDQQLPVKEYVKPEMFETYKVLGEAAGIPVVVSGTFVRSSYNALEAMTRLS